MRVNWSLLIVPFPPCFAMDLMCILKTQGKLVFSRTFVEDQIKNNLLVFPLNLTSSVARSLYFTHPHASSLDILECLVIILDARDCRKDAL